jgi:hypothetical protein
MLLHNLSDALPLLSIYFVRKEPEVRLTCFVQPASAKSQCRKVPPKTDRIWTTLHPLFETFDPLGIILCEDRPSTEHDRVATGPWELPEDLCSSVHVATKNVRQCQVTEGRILRSPEFGRALIDGSHDRRIRHDAVRDPPKNIVVPHSAKYLYKFRRRFAPGFQALEAISNLGNRHLPWHPEIHGRLPSLESRGGILDDLPSNLNASSPYAGCQFGKVADVLCDSPDNITSI